LRKRIDNRALTAPQPKIDQEMRRRLETIFRPETKIAYQDVHALPQLDEIRLNGPRVCLLLSPVKAHISLSGLEKCHNDVLDACKEGGKRFRASFMISGTRSRPELPRKECHYQHSHLSWATLRCDRFRSMCIPHSIISKPKWTASIKSGKTPKGSMPKKLGLKPILGPRWAHGGREFARFPQIEREWAGTN
jgi:hypothetical protein